MFVGITTVCLINIFTGCSKSGGSPTPKSSVPAITALSVNSGPYNTSVIITGIGFSSTLTSDQVFFNGKTAAITAATPTQITALVPLAAGTGNVSVTVNGATANGPVFNYKLSYVIAPFAGVDNFVGDQDGQGFYALFNGIMGLATDAGGNLYVACSGDGLIKKVTPGALSSTIAGGGRGGPPYAGIGNAAIFEAPAGVTVDKTGNIYVSDQALMLISKIIPPNNVTTLAGGLPFTYGELSTNGKGAMASFNTPIGIVVDGSGNVYVADLFDYMIRKITPDGTVTTFAGQNNMPGFVDGIGTAAKFGGISGMAIDSLGNIYAQMGVVIRKITSNGTVSTFAGNGKVGLTDGPGQSATFTSNCYNGIAIDKNGNLFVLDSSGDVIREITPQGVVSTPFPEGSITGNVQTITIDASGNIYLGYVASIRKISMQ